MTLSGSSSVNNWYFFLVCKIVLSSFKPPSETDMMPEGPSFPVCSTFVQELFQAQYRYEPIKFPFMLFAYVIVGDLIMGVLHFCF